MSGAKREEKFGFEGPRDLLKKLRHNIDRFKALDRADIDQVGYAAFDCAITAWSMVDWVWEYYDDARRQELANRLGGKAANKNELANLLFARIPGYQVCYHLATFAKHFGVNKHPVDDLVLVRWSSWPGDADAEPADSEKTLVYSTKDQVFVANDLFMNALFEWSKLLKGL